MGPLTRPVKSWGRELTKEDARRLPSFFITGYEGASMEGSDYCRRRDGVKKEEPLPPHARRRLESSVTRAMFQTKAPNRSRYRGLEL